MSVFGNARVLADVAAGEFQIALLVVGSLCLLVWGIRRVARPENLSLANAPGRANTVSPLHVVLALLIWQCIGSATAMGLEHFTLPKSHVRILTGLITQPISLVLMLALAKLCFRHGLRRGLGLSLRHWGFDSLRGIYALLSALPVCLGLAWLVTWGIRLRWPEFVKNHSLLDAMGEVSGAWQVGVAISAIVLAPLLEEVLFRGLMQSMFRRYLAGPWAAVLATSAIFAGFHYTTPQNIPALFALGVVLGYNYERCGRLWPSILIHALFNGTMIGLQLLP